MMETPVFNYVGYHVVYGGLLIVVQDFYLSLT